MKTTLAIVVFAVLVAGCDGGLLGPVPGSSPERMVRGSADTQTIVVKQPASAQIGGFAKALMEACVGEPLTFVGDGLLVFHVTLHPDGSRTVVVHMNPTGAYAIGQLTGIRYHLGASHGSVSVFAPSGGFTGTFHASLNLLGKKTRFHFPILVHLTVTPDGTVTADIETVGPLTCA